MKRLMRALAIGALTIGAVGLAANALAASHLAKIEVLYAPDYASGSPRECTFFRLAGVAEADPMRPGNPWFAVPKSHPGYFEVFSMLIAARFRERPIRVHTSGSLACGESGVNVVTIE